MIRLCLSLLLLIGFAPAAQIYVNGPISNSTGTGAGGADESVLLTTTLGMGTIGFGHQISMGNRVADDFTIPVGETWTISSIEFFAYQTNSTTTSTITAGTLRIWDGVPGDPGSNIIFGDAVTNVLLATAFSGIYRVTETTSGNTERPIMQNTFSANTVLSAGTYWLDWSTGGSLASGPWAPPIALPATAVTGNGRQFIWDANAGTGTWGDALDGGTNTPAQGFPFRINGSVSSTATPEPFTMTLAAAGLAATAWFRRRTQGVR